MIRDRSPALGYLAFVGVTGFVTLYFVFAAIQGDFGIFRRAEIDARAIEMRLALADLSDEVARMENLTRRLSDDFLDLDLLDEQARDILGLVRADEVVVR